jgi:hypothetical protein
MLIRKSLIVLRPYQAKIILSTAETRALVTGFGAGKSITHCIMSYKYVMDNPGVDYWVVSPTYPIAKETIIPTLFWLLTERMEPALEYGKDFTYHKTDHKFYFKKTKNFIVVRSGENPKMLVGANIGGFGIDEPGIQDYDVYRKMIARRRHPSANYYVSFLAGTPEGINWFSDFCEGELAPKKSFEYVKARTVDNPYLPESFIENLKDSYDPVLLQSYMEGEFVNLGAGFAAYSFSEKNVLPANSFVFKETYPVVVGMDFNYDPFCFTLGQQQPGGKFIYFDEGKYHNCDTDAACEHVYYTLLKYVGNDHEKLKALSLQIIPDATCQNRNAHGIGKSDYLIIKEFFGKLGFKFDILLKEMLRKDSLNCLNRMLLSGTGEQKLLITENCKNIRYEFRKVTMPEFLNSNFKDKMLGHMFDAIRYPIQKLYPIIYERSNTRLNVMV